MRNFQLFDSCRVNSEAESLEFFQSGAKDEHSRLALRREGIYVTISASYGPLEIALRPKYEDLVRTLSRLSVIEGLSTTRQVGTGQAYLAMGVTPEDSLVLRLTIVADATGHMSLNVELNSDARQKLFEWLAVPVGTR
jgi:hypothetical protein